jgi:hypothetical protein
VLRDDKDVVIAWRKAAGAFGSAIGAVGRGWRRWWSSVHASVRRSKADLESALVAEQWQRVLAVFEGSAEFLEFFRVRQLIQTGIRGLGGGIEGGTTFGRGC